MGSRSSSSSPLAALFSIITIASACNGSDNDVGAPDTGIDGGGMDAAPSTSDAAPTSRDAAVDSAIVDAGDSGADAGTIGANGGKITSADHVLEVTVPPGALDHEVALTIERVVDPPAGALGDVYEIGPTGTEFARPVALRFVKSALPNPAPEFITGVTYQDGHWASLPESALDADGNLIALTRHLSRYSYADALTCPCDAPLQCIDGQCLIPCRDTTECPGVAACQNGRCRSVACQQRSDCSVLQSQLNPVGGESYDCDTVIGFCEETCDSAHRACPSPQKCLDLGNVCAWETCSSLSPCPTGQTCAEGWCFPSQTGCTCGVAGCPCSSGGTSSIGGTLTGSGGPISGMRVCVYQNPRVPCATTDGSGQYAMKIPSGEQLIEITKDGYVPILSPVTALVTGGTGPVSVDLSMNSIPTTSEFAQAAAALGTTVDSTKGSVFFGALGPAPTYTPQAGVSAEISPSSGLRGYFTEQSVPSTSLTSTSSNGYGVFANVNPGTVTLSFSTSTAGQSCPRYSDLTWAAPSPPGAATTPVVAGYLTRAFALCSP